MCPGLNEKNKQIIHCANIFLYLGSAVALPMIKFELMTLQLNHTDFSYGLFFLFFCLFVEILAHNLITGIKFGNLSFIGAR